MLFIRCLIVGLLLVPASTAQRGFAAENSDSPFTADFVADASLADSSNASGGWLFYFGNGKCKIDLRKRSTKNQGINLISLDDRDPQDCACQADMRGTFSCFLPHAKTYYFNDNLRESLPGDFQGTIHVSYDSTGFSLVATPASGESPEPVINDQGEPGMLYIGKGVVGRDVPMEAPSRSGSAQ